LANIVAIRTFLLESLGRRLRLAKPYVDAINWTKGIDQKTGKPVDYDPGKDIQVYSDQTFMERARKLCPSMSGNCPALC
jgi:alcohol dehydrogenase (cytochrome c)